MFRLFIFLCFLVQIQQVKAQEHTISNDQQLKTLTYDSLRKAFKSTIHMKPKLGKVYANAYYTKALEEKSKIEIYKGAHQYALAYNKLGQKDSALYFIDVALKESKKVNNDQQYASSLYLKGNIYYSATNYIKAIKNYTKAYDIIQKDNDSIKLARIANSIALIKNQIGETKQALNLSKQNLFFYERLDKKNESRLSDFDDIKAVLNISNA